MDKGSFVVLGPNFQEGEQHAEDKDLINVVCMGRCIVIGLNQGTGSSNGKECSSL